MIVRERQQCRNDIICGSKVAECPHRALNNQFESYFKHNPSPYIRKYRAQTLTSKSSSNSVILGTGPSTPTSTVRTLPLQSPN